MKATTNNKKRLFVVATVGALVLLGGAAYALRAQGMRWLFRPTRTVLPLGKRAPQADAVVAQDLTVPWEVVFLPDGDMLVSERPGTLRRIGKNQQAYTIAGVQHVGEGGLLGVALHPKFTQLHYIYLYLTTASGNGLVNRVERYKLTNDTLTDRTVVLADIPGERNHDGGRLAFGPDGYLYITAGDAGNDQSAQDTHALSGKILRIKDDGTIPPDNPFGNAVYSYGHRNPQGLAWDSSGQLWASEHGRSGATTTGYDELNRIQKSGNYGWPLIQGDEARAGMIAPVVHSGSAETWAPASLAYHNGSLYFGGLRGQSLYQATIQPDGKHVQLTVHERERYGRLRAVTVGPGSFLYVTTSNRDGRGKPAAGDDKIIKVDPAALQ